MKKPKWLDISVRLRLLVSGHVRVTSHGIGLTILLVYYVLTHDLGQLPIHIH
jgi:hypothetical protein